MVTDGDGEIWLTPKEAAEEIGLSVGSLYRLKNFLTHRKAGTSKGRVFFLKRTLVDDYLNI